MRWLARKEIVRKAVGIGALHALSKGFGFLRELALARFLGVGALADAFFTSWRVPSLMRRFLAEGALNAAAVPQILHIGKTEGKRSVSQCITALLIVVQLLLCLMLFAIWYDPRALLWLLVPGWGAGDERLMLAQYAVRWAMIVIVPFSASALLAGALQVVHHFFIPAASQFVFNVLLVAHIAIGIYQSYQLGWLLAGIVGYSCVTLLLHGWMYWSHGFSLVVPDALAWKRAVRIIRSLGACCLTYGAFEINLLADHMLVSYLAVGSQALLYYVSAFLQMPLSICIAAFSTVLLPHFSAIRGKTRRQQFYLLEALKVAVWMLLPAAIVMMLFARSIFATTILAHGDAQYVIQAAWLLAIGACGLVPFAINRICTNVLYSVDMAGWAAVITLGGTAINVVLSFASMMWMGLYGVIAATVCSAWCKSVGFIYVLHAYAGIDVPLSHGRIFLGRYISQLAVTGWGVYVLYMFTREALAWLAGSWHDIIIHGLGMWFWIGPMVLLWMYSLYMTRRRFGVRLYFLRSATSR